MDIKIFLFLTVTLFNLLLSVFGGVALTYSVFSDFVAIILSIIITFLFFCSLEMQFLIAFVNNNQGKYKEF